MSSITAGTRTIWHNGGLTQNDAAHRRPHGKGAHRAAAAGQGRAPALHVYIAPAAGDDTAVIAALADYCARCVETGATG